LQKGFKAAYDENTRVSLSLLTEAAEQAEEAVDEMNNY
jgi:hypothetical protein